MNPKIFESKNTSNNLQWVHKDVNRMKNNLKQDEFLYFCSKIASCNES